MAKQTLVIESPMGLSLSDGMLVISDRTTGEKTLRSIEDIRMVVIDNRMAHITVPLLTRLSELNVGVVFCNDRHIPTSIVMDLESNSLQGKRFRCQLSASAPTNKQLWKQIVEAKIRNQSLLLEKLGRGQALLASYYSNVKSGDSTNREGVAAKVYWKALLGPDFVRDRYGPVPNGLLNYGYALLRATMARVLMSAGLLPMVGIFHHNTFDSFPLADDMMEPYRPFIDQRVMYLAGSGVTDVCRETKESLLAVFYEDNTSQNLQQSVSALNDVYVGRGKALFFPTLT
ncbi:MAG: type II CRISPR-associated endonuclease Cas1 [Bacteroidaceae bacterium]|nr:type II CRISPR-associated endonuclease Cas1 [Bacteroidaceae bacterium]